MREITEALTFRDSQGGELKIYQSMENHVLLRAPNTEPDGAFFCCTADDLRRIADRVEEMVKQENNETESPSYEVLCAGCNKTHPVVWTYSYVGKKVWFVGRRYDGCSRQAGGFDAGWSEGYSTPEDAIEKWFKCYPDSKEFRIKNKNEQKDWRK